MRLNAVGVDELLESLYRTSSRRMIATLIRVLGDFDAAEDAMHEAFVAAAMNWTERGVPSNPESWLMSTARFKGIDTIRRSSTCSRKLPLLALDLRESDDPADAALEPVPDDQLRLIFTCCHPDLSLEGRVALTLREVCGLTTDEIASAFLTRTQTIAQRIVRAKARIREEPIRYSVPDANELPERIEGALQVIYLVFTEGYAASAGDSLTRPDLSREAIRLGRELAALLPDPEVRGLLALMLLQDSRRDARTDTEGNLVLLEDQDRGLWNRDQIVEGVALVEALLSGRTIGPYAIQAAIAAVHAAAPDSDATNWARIVELYDLLLQAGPNPVVALNRAIAVSKREGPDAALELVEELLETDQLCDHHLAHAARADMLRRLDRLDEAVRSYRKAIELCSQETERRFLERRLNEIDERSKS